MLSQTRLDLASNDQYFGPLVLREIIYGDPRQNGPYIQSENFKSLQIEKD